MGMEICDLYGDEKCKRFFADGDFVDHNLIYILLFFFASQLTTHLLRFLATLLLIQVFLLSPSVPQCPTNVLNV